MWPIGAPLSARYGFFGGSTHALESGASVVVVCSVVVGVAVADGSVTTEDSDEVELELQAAVTRPRVARTAKLKVRRSGFIHAI